MFPSGWQIMGDAQDVFFDVTKSPPALLVPGGKINFALRGFSDDRGAI